MIFIEKNFAIDAVVVGDDRAGFDGFSGRELTVERCEFGKVYVPQGGTGWEPLGIRILRLCYV